MTSTPPVWIRRGAKYSSLTMSLCYVDTNLCRKIRDLKELISSKSSRRLNNSINDLILDMELCSLGYFMIFFHFMVFTFVISNTKQEFSETKASVLKRKT